ncbi:MAG: hypothetical protein PVSMB4_17130 [Ktedonobacterales bacterium]
MGIAAANQQLTTRGTNKRHAPTHDDWPALARQLVVALEGCAACFDRHVDGAARAAACQGVLDGVRASITQASQFARDLSASLPAQPDGLEGHPLIRLAQSYAAAFQAVGVACLLAEHAATLDGDPLGPRLITLACESAETLVQANRLIFGQRLLGSPVQMCGHVGKLEDQADEVFRNAIASRLGDRAAPSNGPTWSQHQADELRILSALEALTDRCEDIADMLLVVAFIV